MQANLYCVCVCLCFVCFVFVVEAFTSYSIFLYASTWESSSLDGPASQPVVVKTVEGRPQDVVLGISVTTTFDMTANISWLPPRQANGVILGYQLQVSNQS